MNTPEPDANPDPVELVVDEFASRLRDGQYPSVTEFVERFPDHADELSDLLPAVAMMEQLKVKDNSHINSLEKQTAMSGLQQLGDFRILREIGHGGMGVVYEAVQESLGRHVALKVLSPTALNSANAVDRFCREAATAGRLHHTNIVPVFGVGEESGLHYYVMQLIHGESLSDVIRSLRISSTNPKLSQRDSQATKTFVRNQRDPKSSTSNSQVDDDSSVGTSSAASSSDAADPPVIDRFSIEDSASMNGVKLSPVDMLSKVNPTDSIGQTTIIGAPQVGDNSELPRDNQAITKRLIDEFNAKNYWHAVAEMGRQVAEALQYAHSLGVWHRDVKPANLLVSAGVVWLADFGLAKLNDEHDLTQTGDLMGTLRYMSPEQLAGKCDARSEVYSLGLTLYELATFRYARHGSIKSQIIQQIAEESPPRPSSVNKQIPADLETIILKATALDPKHRYQTAGDLAEDLSRFRRGYPIAARRVGRLEQLFRWTRRNPALATTTIATFVLLITVACLSTWGLLAAREANVALQEEREKFVAERQRAEDNVTMAMVAFESLVENVAARGVPQSLQFEIDEEAGEVPIASSSITQADRELLGQLLKFYQEFAAKNQSSPKVAESTGRAYSRIGDIHRCLGEHKKAIVAYNDAAKKYVLIKKPTDLLQHSLDRATLYNDIGIVETKRQNHREAAEAHASVIRFLEKQPAEIRAADETSFLIASTYNLIASNYFNGSGSGLRGRSRGPGGQSSDGRNHGRFGGFDQRGFGGRPPRVVNPDQRSDNKPDGERNTNRSPDSHRPDTNKRPTDQRLENNKRPEDPAGRAPRGPSEYHHPYRANRKIAVGLLDKLVKSDPLNPDYKLEMARFHRNGVRASDFFSDLHAIEELNQAVSILTALVEEFPDKPQYRFELADTLAISCRSLEREDTLANHSSRYQRSAQIASGLHTGFPDVLDYTVLLANSTFKLSHTYEQLKDHAKAKETLNQAMDIQRHLVKSQTEIDDGKSIGSFNRFVFSRMLLASAAYALNDDEFESALATIRESRSILDEQSSGHKQNLHPMHQKFLQWQLSKVMMQEVELLERMDRDSEARELRDRIKRLGSMFGIKHTDSGRGGYNGPPRHDGQRPPKRPRPDGESPSNDQSPERVRPAS